MHKGNEYRTTVVCIDRYENGVPEGRLYNPAIEGAGFLSLSQFLVKMEDFMDTMKVPQSFAARRSFGDAPEAEGTPESGGDVQTGRVATFAVRVLFRQNASWQGSVKWLEGNREESFRSVLELILLMDSAMQKKS